MFKANLFFSWLIDQILTKYTVITVEEDFALSDIHISLTGVKLD